MITVIPAVAGCLGGRLKELKENIKQNFDYIKDKTLELIVLEMQKTVLWETKSLIRKILSGLLT